MQKNIDLHASFGMIFCFASSNSKSIDLLNQMNLIYAIPEFLVIGRINHR